MTPANQELERRRAATASDFTAGDVVFDIEDPWTRGIVSEVHARSVSVVWEHGGTSGGPGLVAVLLHQEPRARVDVPAGALGHRWWNRHQAVLATFRRAGIG